MLNFEHESRAPKELWLKILANLISYCLTFPVLIRAQQKVSVSVFKFAKFAPGACSQIFNCLNIVEHFAGWKFCSRLAPEDVVYPSNRWFTRRSFAPGACPWSPGACRGCVGSGSCVVGRGSCVVRRVVRDSSCLLEKNLPLHDPSHSWKSFSDEIQ